LPVRDAPSAGPPDSDGRDAREFWIGRGHMAKDVSAVDPGTANSRYAGWTRRCMQEWTIGRARRHLGRRARRAVDLGCGFGDWTVRFAELADEIIACDVSPGFVDEARRRLREAGHPAATVALGDVRGFSAYDDADLVYLGAVLMYLDDAGCLSVLRGVRERIAADGVLLSRDWCAIRLGRARVNRQPWFSAHRRPRRYVELAEQSGFRVVEWASSPAIYSEAVAWPAGWLWLAASLFWTRASVSFVMRPV
jgi:SAM-dependent methyltransferase